MNQTELVKMLQDRIDGIAEYLNSDQNDSAYNREYCYGANDAYITVLNVLGVQHDNEYYS